MPTQEVVACIDRSGSMVRKESDTVGGINAAINELKRNKGADDTIRVSMKLFDHEQILKYRSLDIDEVRDMEVSEFVPRGQTALLDAIGDTLRYFMEKKLRDPTAYDSCTIYVATDGFENASTRHTPAAIKELIENAEKTYNIQMLYLGANQDAILMAGQLGISQERAINYSENTENVEAVYRGAARVASAYRTMGDSAGGFTPAERSASQVTDTPRCSSLPPPVRRSRSMHSNSRS